MKTIFQIDSGTIFGGGQRIILTLIEAFLSSANMILVAPEGVLVRICKEKFPQLPILILPKGGAIKKILALRRFIRVYTPDIIHLHGTRAAFWGRLALIGINKRKPIVIYTLHGFHLIRRKQPLKLLLLIAERFLNKFTDILVCVSNTDKKLVLKHRIIAANKITIIYNGTKIPEHINSRVYSQVVSLKKKFGISPQDIVLLYIGRLDVPKDIETIIKAIKILIFQKRYKNVRLIIVGEGPHKKSLIKSSSQLQDYIFFVGFQQEVIPFLIISNVLVLSSEWEGLPLVLLEAGAFKKPIIGSNVDGIKEIIRDGYNGYLFEFKNPVDLANKIEKFLQNPHLLNQLGNNNFQLVKSRFSLERMLDQYKSLYFTYDKNSSSK